MKKRYVYTPQKIKIDVTHNKDGSTDIRVPDALPGGERKGELWIGFYDTAVKTKICASENRGETITNANIVRTYKRISDWDGNAIATRVDLKALGATGRDGCVVILQSAQSGPIIGAASFPL